MNELPIVLISKELKYLLSNEKVKTLEKAIDVKDTITDQTKRRTIESVQNKYQKIKLNVQEAFQKLNTSSLVKGQTEEVHTRHHHLTMDKVYNFLESPSITEIYGAKGTGKTCLLIHYIEKFTQLHGEVGINVYIFNGASGMTQKRLARLNQYRQEEKCKIQYHDCSMVEDMIKFCSKLLQFNDSRPSLIAVDSMVSLLLGQEKTKPLVCKLFRIFMQLYKQHGFTIIYTNLVQHKFQLGNQELYNHISYHSQYQNQFITNKLYLERPSKNQFRFKGIQLKSLNKYRFWFEIEEEGVGRVGTEGMQFND